MRVIVIGGGIAGLTTAYQLVREGHEVTIFDSGSLGTGASVVNAGWVVPGDAYPVPGPGIRLQALTWLLNRQSPVSIRPSLKPRFIEFMLGMWRACNASAQNAGFIAQFNLARNAPEILKQYLDDGIEFSLSNSGLLMVVRTHKALEELQGSVDVGASIGVQSILMDHREVHSHEPLLTDAVIGGVFLPDEYHVDPEQLVTGLIKFLREKSIEIHEHTAITGIWETRSDRGHYAHVRDQHSVEYRADNVVLATGSWSQELAANLGLRLLMEPGKGYGIDLPPVKLKGPVDLFDAKVALTPYESHLRVAGTMQFGGFSADVSRPRVAGILKSPEAYIKGWSPPRNSDEIAKAGLRPMTADGLPIIGRVPGKERVYLNTGHGMLGMTMAHSSAQALVKELNGDHQVVLEPFAPHRYGWA